MYVYHVRRAGLLIQETARHHNPVATLDKVLPDAGRYGVSYCLPQVFRERHRKPPDPPHKRHPVDHFLVRADRQYLDGRAVSGDEPRRVPGAGYGNDGLCFQVSRDPACRVPDGIGRPALRPAAPLLEDVGVVDGLLGPCRDPRHSLDDPHWVSPDRRLGGKHHRVRAVEYRVRHIARLGPGRPRVFHHRLEHLCRGDHGPRGPQRLVYQLFLHQRHFLCAHLYAQVSACHHHAVRDLQYGVNVLDRLTLLHLSHYGGVVTQTVDRLPQHANVRRVTHEGLRDPVDPGPESNLEVAPVALGERGKFKGRAGEVHPLALHEDTTFDDLASYVFPAYISDLKPYQPVIHKHSVAGLQVARQPGIGETLPESPFASSVVIVKSAPGRSSA